MHLLSFGPSGVRALPLGVAAGAERSVHYFLDYFSFFLSFWFCLVFRLRLFFGNTLWGGSIFSMTSFNFFGPGHSQDRGYMGG